MAEGSVQVKPTGDARGNGAYAARTIPQGSFVIQYEGEWLDWPAFERRCELAQAVGPALGPGRAPQGRSAAARRQRSASARCLPGQSR
jgi:hypothetical protein